MNESVVYTYLAQKVIEDIQEKKLSGDIALELSVYPFNDYIRQSITSSFNQSHLPWIHHTSFLSWTAMTRDFVRSV